MPNLRKNRLSMDFYGLFQSTDKQMIYGRIYGFFLTRFGYYPLSPRPPLHFRNSRYSTDKKTIFGQIYGFFRTEFGYYPPPPPPTLDSRYFARAELNFSAAPSELFRLLPEISGFFGIPIGQLCNTNDNSPDTVTSESILYACQD